MTTLYGGSRHEQDLDLEPLLDGSGNLPHKVTFPKSDLGAIIRKGPPQGEEGEGRIETETYLAVLVPVHGGGGSVLEYWHQDAFHPDMRRIHHEEETEIDQEED